MIITKTVKFIINTRDRKYYRNLGYHIPKEKSPVVEISIKDLNKKSIQIVECECDVCHKINTISFVTYNKNISSYGYYSCGGKCSKLKTKKTLKEKYGDENYVNVDKYKETCLKKYGVDNISKLNDVKNKKIKTSLENWGVENPSQSNEIKNKKIKTSIINCGFEHPMQNKETQRKSKKTLLKKYGVENYTQTEEYRMTSKQTNLEKYGFESYTQTNDYKIKCKKTKLEKYGNENYNNSEKNIQTCLERYGVKYPQQNLEIFNKQQSAALQMKKFKATDLHYQGTYELDFLNIYYDKLDIKNGTTVRYNDNKIYFPDFYIPENNLIVEIKSDYTFNKELEENLAKQKACLEQGYNFIFIINKDYSKFDELLN